MKDNKNISLFIDTATKSLCIGALFGDDIFISNEMDSKKSLEYTNILIEELGKKAGFNLRDVDSFYCLLGPGSNTGIRLGLTIPKTILAFNPNIKIYGIDTLKVFLFNQDNGYAALSDRSGNLFLGEMSNGEYSYKKVNKEDISSIDKNKTIFVEKSDTSSIDLLANFNIQKLNVVAKMIEAKSIFEDYSDKDEAYLPIYFQQI